MSGTDEKVQWLDLVGQLTAALITALKGSGQPEEATKLQAIAHSNPIWSQVLQTAQGDVTPPPAD